MPRTCLNGFRRAHGYKEGNYVSVEHDLENPWKTTSICKALVERYLANHDHAPGTLGGSAGVSYPAARRSAAKGFTLGLANEKRCAPLALS